LPGVFLSLLGGDSACEMREDRLMSQAQRGPIRIVIADDDPLFARMLRATLSERPGLDVVGLAANGQEAVALSDELEPDLVLLDVSMPVLDGIEAAELIQDSDAAPEIILITGDDEASATRAYSIDAAAYLRKSACVLPVLDVVMAVSQAVASMG
jgi:DNA-binding NarL/FixJ family response regulator